jgi:hypothetical protein
MKPNKKHQFKSSKPTKKGKRTLNAVISRFKNNGTNFSTFCRTIPIDPAYGSRCLTGQATGPMAEQYKKIIIDASKEKPKPEQSLAS